MGEINHDALYQYRGKPDEYNALCIIKLLKLDIPKKCK